jgi:hypothetical protein
VNVDGLFPQTMNQPVFDTLYSTIDNALSSSAQTSAFHSVQIGPNVDSRDNSPEFPSVPEILLEHERKRSFSMGPGFDDHEGQGSSVKRSCSSVVSDRSLSDQVCL